MLIIIENKTTKEPTCKVVFTPLSSADFNAVPKLILDAVSYTHLNYTGLKVASVTVNVQAVRV